MSLAELDHLLDPGSRPMLPSVEVAPWLSVYESLVAGAGALAQVEQAVVPALLQTKSYAEWMERHGPLDLSPSQLAARVDARMRRQEPLHRTANPLRLHCLLAGGTLHRRVGDSGVMREQLARLLELAELPNIELQLLADDGRGVCPSGFQLLRRSREPFPFLAVTFDVAQPRYHERPEMVAIFQANFDYLHRYAMSAEESSSRIHETMRNLR